MKAPCGDEESPCQMKGWECATVIPTENPLQSLQHSGASGHNQPIVLTLASLFG